MIRWIVGSSLKFRGLIVAIAAVLLALGITRLNDAPVDVLPEYLPPTVEIQAEALGLSAVELEQLVTTPFEQDSLNGVAFLKEIRSETVPGLASIEMVFEPGTDIFTARQVVQERVAESLIALPGASDPPQMLQPLSSTNRVLMIGVSSEEVSPIELGVLARWTITPELLSVPGVANVAMWGFRDRQLQVQVDPEQLQADGVSLQQVVETTANALWASPLSFVEASVPGVGGFIDNANQRLGVRHVSPIVTAEDLAQIRVQGTAYALGEVAEVVEDHQPLIGEAVGPDLVLVVEKFPGANAVDVTHDLEHKLETLRPGLAGVELDTSIYRPAGFIESAIDNLTLTLIIAAVLVALVIGAFFWSWRTALVSFVAIPLSVVTAGLVLYLLDATINAMILAGLVAALVVVIDDATIDVERFARRLRQRRGEGAPRSSTDVILAASEQVRNPMIFAALVMALALVPVMFLEGFSGAFLPDIAAAYLVAIAASLVVALTVTPALSLLLSRGAGLDRREPPVAAWIRSRYERILSRVLRRPSRAYVAVGAIVVAGIAAIPFLDQSPLPQFKETELVIHWDGAPGASLTEMDRITSQAAAEIDAIPGVQNVEAQIGRAITGDQVVGVNSAELWVSIDPDADFGATVAEMEDVVSGYPGLEASVLTYSNSRANEALTGTTDDLTVRVFGQDLDVLRVEAEKVKQLVSATDGVAGARLDLPVEEPTIEVEVDLAAAQGAGVKPGDVRRAAAILLSGINVGSLFEEQKVFDVVVWGVPEVRQSVTDVQELLIDTPTGGHVRLGEVADVRIAPNPSVIKHESVSRYLDVIADVEGRSVGAVTADVDRGLKTLAFPLEYHAEVVTDDDRSLALLIGIVIAVAAGAFLLLQACFGSWRLATLAFLVLPMGLAGGVLAALAAGGTVSLGSVIGFFAVGGIAARHGILLIRRHQRLEREVGVPFGPELAMRASAERAVPIVLTALAVSLATLPVLIRGSIPGHEVIQPLAVVLLGGLVASVLVTLFVLPPLYLRLGPSPEPAPEELEPVPSSSSLGPSEGGTHHA